MGDNYVSDPTENWLDARLVRALTILQTRDESPSPIALRPSSHFRGRYIKNNDVFHDYVKISAAPPMYMLPIIPTAEIAASKCDLCLEEFTDQLHWPAILARCDHVFGAACLQHYVMEKIVSLERTERNNQNSAAQVPKIFCPEQFCLESFMLPVQSQKFAPLYRYIDHSGDGSRLERVEWPVRPYATAAWLNDVWGSWERLSEKSPRWVRIDPLLIELIKDRHKEATHPLGYDEIIGMDSAMNRMTEGWRKAIVEDKDAVNALHEVFQSWSNDDRRQEVNDALIWSIMSRIMGLLRTKWQKEGFTTRLPLSYQVAGNSELLAYLKVLVTHCLIASQRHQDVAF